MTENIIKDFNTYIVKCVKEAFLVELINSRELCLAIVDNDLFWKNIDTILLKFGSDYTFEIFKILCNIDKKIFNKSLYHLIESNICITYDYIHIFDYITTREIISKKEFSNLIEHLIKNKCSKVNLGFIVCLLNYGYGDIIKNNIDIIFNKCNNLFGLKSLIKKDEIILELFNDYVNKNPDKLILQMLTEGFQREYYEIAKVLEREKVFDMTKIILSELLLNQNLNYSDIDFFQSGEYSEVYSIGSKVLKIGKEREKFIIDNNKRFLKPVLRTEITSNGEVIGCIEITEKVDTTNITQIDAQFIYNELRDSGYIWADCRPNNLGRLLKKNEVHFKNLVPVMRSVNYRTESKEVLEAGQLVIVDNDYIFKEDELSKMSNDDQELILRAVCEYEIEYQSQKERKRRQV